MTTFTAATVNAPAGLKHERLKSWVAEIANLAQPDRVYWADGSQEEYDRLCAEMVASGMLVKLNPTLRPHLHLLAAQGRRGSNEQLGRSGEDARHAAGSLRRLHARPHDVRRAVLDGPHR